MRERTVMKLFVNQAPLQVQQDITLSELLIQLQRSEEGVAMAVGGSVVPRSQWAEFILTDGSQVALFSAMAGG